MYPSASAVIVAVRSYSGAAVSLAFLASALQLRMARGAVATLATTLAGPVTPALVRDALRTALADPQLQVGYWEAERSEWVDGEGAPVESGRTTPVDSSRTHSHPRVSRSPW